MTPNPNAARERAECDAALRGDRDAWRSLFEQHYECLRAYAAWRCGGRADWTDDVVQETWLVAVRTLTRFDPARGSLRSWLRGIASNCARNGVRGRHRDARRVVPLATVPESATHADSVTESAESAESVALALAALPERYEAVLRAKYLDGDSVAQIAADLGQSEKAIESLLGRARHAFREAYETNHDRPR